MDRPRDALKPIDKNILDEAYLLVTGDRQAAYDHPSKNFARIAALWSPIFGVEVTPAQVALAMIQVKVARELHAHKKDNITDLVGYALTLEAVT
jgi:hypothetical protein